MDQAFFALAETVIRHIDERYGRVAGWAAAIFIITIGLGAIWLAILWLLRAVP